MNVKLSRLEKVDLREIFKSEPFDFTPWLASEENLKLLSDEIGISLELEGKEVNVGPFSADILCKDTSTDNFVLIENQLEKTDHTHLGQIITYAAGLKARTIIWISKEFTEEHRNALDWLNEYTSSDFHFFGIQVELWKIGNSEKAPKFMIVSKPNDWSKIVHDNSQKILSSNLSENKALQLEFWQEFNLYLTLNSSILKPTKALPQHWMNISIGKSGFKLCGIASFYDNEKESFDSNEIRAEFNIEGINSNDIFINLESDRINIENEAKEILYWHNPEKTKSAKIYFRKTTNLTNRENWKNDFLWLKEHLETLHKIFRNKIL